MYNNSGMRGYASLGNSRSLGTSNRYGSSILVGSSRSNIGGFTRIYNHTAPPKRPELLYKTALWLYGPSASAPRRGL